MYLIDSVVLITAKNSYYAFDLCPGFWNNLLDKHQGGLVHSLDRNRLTITRQVAFISVMKKADGKNRRCIIDVILSLNSLPLVTAELKPPHRPASSRCRQPIQKESR